MYVSTDSWQTRFHNSAPVRVLQGVLSMGPVPRPRRLDFLLVSSPTDVGVKWLTSRQQRKWLMAAERLETSTPCQDILTRLKLKAEISPCVLGVQTRESLEMLMGEMVNIPGESC